MTLAAPRTQPVAVPPVAAKLSGLFPPGVSLFALSRRMGTSLAMIDQTYGHLAPDAEERERDLLDAYDETFGQLADTGNGADT